jgi:hypothetical protein
MIRRIVFFTVVPLSLLIAAVLAAPPGSPVANLLSTTASDSISTVVQRLVVENLPQQFEEKKGWGKQKPVVDGLRWRDDGDGPKLRKHTHEANDGLWKQYKASVVDPQHQLQIRVADLKETDSQHATMSVFITAKLQGEARLEQWKDGVKLYTITTDADAKILSRLDWEIAWHWESGKVLGDFVVEPKVTAADIELVDFDLKKVSKIEGWAAHELGEGFKHTLAKKLREHEPKIVDKINKAIQKKPDRLHFSPDKTVEKTLSKVESLLGF